MDEIAGFVDRISRHFQARLGSSLTEVYKLGSLAHGGFSSIYSDIDVGLLLNCAQPPAHMAALVEGAKTMHADFGKKLSVFWGNPEFSWGRLPVIDRLDLLDYGVPLLRGCRPEFRRPTEAEIHRALEESIENSWKPRIAELQGLTRLEASQRKPYVRAILYAARLIYTWDKLVVNSNDEAVHYLHQVRPRGLDLRAIDAALACRRGQCTAEDVLHLRTDLERQLQAAAAYIAEQK